MRPIIPGSEWSFEVDIKKPDGTDEDISGATYRARLSSNAGTVIDLDSNGDDGSFFSTVDEDGASSATGPVLRVTIPAEGASKSTEILQAYSSLRFQAEVELASGAIRTHEPVQIPVSKTDFSELSTP